jgi:hypothetical protein
MGCEISGYGAQEMKVIAIFQFYFPYVLPRADDWPSGHIGFKYPDFMVGLHPRNPDEALFPYDIDKTLSTMSLSLARISPPTGLTSLTVQERCHDRIEVRVHGDIDSPNDAKMENIKEKFLDIAIHACNTFLNHCRVAARSPFVIGLERNYRIEDGRFYILTPYTTSWFCEEDGSLLPAYEGNVNGDASSGGVRSPESGVTSFAVIEQSLQACEYPNLPQSLIVDAEEYIRTQRLREAIISLGTACEVASNEYLNRTGRSNEPRIKSILRRHDSFAEKRYHLLTDYISGKSFKTEEFTNFELIEKAYRTRNNLVHQGRLFFEDSGSVVDVNQQLATQFLAASEASIEWITSL